MALPAFRNGKPLFKNGKPAFSAAPCACCSACGSLAGTACTVCSSGSYGATPTQVEAVASGVTIACCIVNAVRSMDATVGTFAGTFTLTTLGGVSACTYRYNETPGSTVDFQLWSNTTCGATLLGANRNWSLDVTVRDPGGGASKKVRATIQVATQAGTGIIYFDGEVDMADPCVGTYTINNGDGGLTALCAGGGSVTVHFCP